MNIPDPQDAMFRQIVGDKGMELAAGTLEFFERFVDELPAGYEMRLEITKRRGLFGGQTRADLTITREDHGYGEFLLIDRDGKLELLLRQISPL